MMKILRSSSEAEMVAEFLRQEYASRERYGATIDAVLADLGYPPELITATDLSDADQNRDRRRLLGRYRGYGERRNSYFTDFPDSGVTWQWVQLTRDEALTTRFVNYWAEIWECSHRPRDLASAIRRGNVPDWAIRDGAIDRLTSFAERLRDGLQVPPLLLVSADGGHTRVVMEGHARLTAYALAEDVVPETLEALLGTSPDIANWDEYSSGEEGMIPRTASRLNL